MQIQITSDQCYCSFADGIVYEFVPYDFDPLPFTFAECSFSVCCGVSLALVKCCALPCQMLYRKDKKDGFWQISQTIDYQAFTEMLKNGG